MEVKQDFIIQVKSGSECLLNIQEHTLDSNTSIAGVILGVYIFLVQSLVFMFSGGESQ